MESFYLARVRWVCSTIGTASVVETPDLLVIAFGFQRIFQASSPSGEVIKTYGLQLLNIIAGSAAHG